MPARPWIVRAVVSAPAALLLLAGLSACDSPTASVEPLVLAGTSVEPSSSTQPRSSVVVAAPDGDFENVIPAADDVLIVKIIPGTDPEAFATRLGLVLVRVLDDDTIIVADVNDTNVLDGDGEVASYEPNQEIALAFGQELTMGFFEGSTFSETSLRGSSALELTGAPTLHGEFKGTGVRIGVVDTGADIRHPLLVDRVIRSQHADALDWIELANREDDDGDGDIDEAYGHGTMVAGVIVQIAPKVTVIPVRALNSDGVGSLADLLTALDALRKDQVDVINLSLSLSQYSPLMEERLQMLDDEGILVIAASGNQGETTAYPANSPLAIGVAATATPAVLASFSNIGADCELAAPGVGLLSSFPENRLGWGDGTSFAAPVVAGGMALVLDAQLDPKALLYTALPLPPLQYGELRLGAVLGQRSNVDRTRHVKAD